MVWQHQEDDEPWWRSWVDDLFEADDDLRRRVEDFWTNMPSGTKVGTRHHTVPRFHLDRFAKDGQLLVRDRNSGLASTRNINDLAIKNFYTFTNDNGEKDGRFEEIIGGIEGTASEIFKRLLNPFAALQPLDPGESMALGLFLSLQLIRTPRHRREMELMADYATKLQHRHNVPDIDEYIVVPHRNLHLGFMASALFKISEELIGRPITLVTLDAPLFVTCDEPVLLVADGDHVRHVPGCFKTEKQRRKAARRQNRNRRRHAEIVHFYPSRPGVAQAIELGFPLNPRTLLVLGQRSADDPLHVRLAGSGAIEFADDVNRHLIEQAYLWVAANPTHPTFESLGFPPPKPLVQVCDGGTPAGRALSHPPRERWPERLNSRWS